MATRFNYSRFRTIKTETMHLFNYIKEIEDRKGRKLDLNQYTDIYPLAEIVEREIKLREVKLQ